MKLMIKMHHHITTTNNITINKIVTIKCPGKTKTQTTNPIIASHLVATEVEVVLISPTIIKGVGLVAEACIKIITTIVAHDPIITEDHGNKITIMVPNDVHLIIIN